MTINIVLADDHRVVREGFRALLAGQKDFQIVAECGHGAEAVAAVSDARPDVLFLDVRMPGMDGFDVLRQIPPETMPAVVFVTAYDRYAPQAFEQHAIEYLLKPFTDERFADAALFSPSAAPHTLSVRSTFQKSYHQTRPLWPPSNSSE